jgi:ParB-like chromosome segregation protein Spo0J
VRRGEIRWYTFVLPDKQRAVLAEGLSRAALARRLGVSRAWVTKAMRALQPPLKRHP